MKLVLAPMATLSHEALRVLIHRYGDLDEYFSEMIHAPSFIAGGRFERWYVRTNPVPEKMVWQITGNTAGPIAQAAEMLLPYGGIGLDLNMGCSAPEIVRSGAGIAWMLKPLDETQTMVQSVRAVIDTHLPHGGSRLSVKLRLGDEENYQDLLQFCNMLIDSGVETITLHPRIKKDSYSRPARREYVRRLVSDLPVPVYGNGDISSPELAIDYQRETSCAGLMLGRSAVSKPWIFAQIRKLIHPEETGLIGKNMQIDHREVASFFMKALLLSQPPEFQISRLHRFFFYYCENFSFSHHIKMKIQNAKSHDQIEALLDEYFLQVPQDRYVILS